MLRVVASGRAEETIDGGGRDGFEGFEDGQGERGKGLGITREPERQDDLEAFRAGEVGGQPDEFQGFEDRFLGIEGSSSAFFELGFDKTSEFPQPSDGMFAVALIGSAEFVQDSSFLFTRGFLVT